MKKEVKTKLLKSYKRRLHRLTERAIYLHSKYDDKTHTLTYHAGWNLGYVEGQITELEQIINVLSTS